MKKGMGKNSEVNESDMVCLCMCHGYEKPWSLTLKGDVSAESERLIKGNNYSKVAKSFSTCLQDSVLCWRVYLE